MTEQNPFDEIPLGYFNALMATVMGSDQQRIEAKKYLAEVDPDVWDEQLKIQLLARYVSGLSTGLRAPVENSQIL